MKIDLRLLNLNDKQTVILSRKTHHSFQKLLGFIWITEAANRQKNIRKYFTFF